jgi:hypothetical protein
MKVCGFTFIRNAVQYDYPVVEAIMSVLPLCDEFIVAVGASDDDTRKLIESIPSSRITILDTVWDDSLRSDGRVLALETDKAFQAIAGLYDWAFYIQGDEVIHEKYLPALKKGMEDYLHDQRVEGLLLKYIHFYGSYDYVGEALSWYRREIRIIRNRKDIFSYRDAQGFRKKPNQKLHVKLIDAYVHHYGWVRDPRSLQRKHRSMQRHWHDDAWIGEHIAATEEFDYGDSESLSLFTGTHPEVMQARILKKNWKFDRDIAREKFSFKDKLRRAVERITGWRMGEYKNYILLR